MGKIGLAVSPQHPDVVYATIELGAPQGRLLPLGRRRRDAGRSGATTSPAAPGRTTTRRSTPIRTEFDGIYQPTSACTSPTTAARPSDRSSRSTSTSTTTPSPSIPTTPTTCWSAATAACTRRWDLGEELEVLRQPAAHPVLQGGRRQRRAVLQRLRRHPGQQHPGRPVADDEHQRHPELRLVHHPLRRRPPAGSRPGEPRHRLLRVAAGEPGALRPQDRRGDAHPTPARRRGARRALELGLADPDQPPRPGAALLRQPAGVALRRPGRQLAVDLGGPLPPPRPPGDADDGPGPELRRGVGPARDVELRQRHLARRVAPGRGPDLRRHRRRPDPGHRRMAAPPGARSTACRGCRRRASSTTSRPTSTTPTRCTWPSTTTRPATSRPTS